jgi:hypothetical protein
MPTISENSANAQASLPIPILHREETADTLPPPNDVIVCNDSDMSDDSTDSVGYHCDLKTTPEYRRKMKEERRRLNPGAAEASYKRRVARYEACLETAKNKYNREQNKSSCKKLASETAKEMCASACAAPSATMSASPAKKPKRHVTLEDTCANSGEGSSVHQEVVEVLSQVLPDMLKAVLPDLIKNMTQTGGTSVSSLAQVGTTGQTDFPVPNAVRHIAKSADANYRWQVSVNLLGGNKDIVWFSMELQKRVNNSMYKFVCGFNLRGTAIDKFLAAIIELCGVYARQIYDHLQYEKKSGREVQVTNNGVYPKPETVREVKDDKYQKCVWIVGVAFCILDCGVLVTDPQALASPCTRVKWARRTVGSTYLVRTLMSSSRPVWNCGMSSLPSWRAKSSVKRPGVNYPQTPNVI